jgi:transmembrane protein
MNANKPSHASTTVSRRLATRLLCLLISSPFWMSGLAKLGDWGNTISTMTHFHLSPPAPYAVATMLVELLGSAMLIVGPYSRQLSKLSIWLGAIALSSFTALTIPGLTCHGVRGRDHV